MCQKSACQYQNFSPIDDLETLNTCFSVVADLMSPDIEIQRKQRDDLAVLLSLLQHLQSIALNNHIQDLHAQRILDEISEGVRNVN